MIAVRRPEAANRSVAEGPDYPSPRILARQTPTAPPLALGVLFCPGIPQRQRALGDRADHNSWPASL